jgi:hypothetical protein
MNSQMQEEIRKYKKRRNVILVLNVNLRIQHAKNLILKEVQMHLNKEVAKSALPGPKVLAPK